MRILFVTHRFLPDYLAGTEVYTAALARALAQHGHDVRIFTGHPLLTAPQTYTWEGLEVDAVPWGAFGQGAVSTFLAGFRNPRVEQHFQQVCRTFQPTLVHVQHLMGLSPHLLTIARRQGARVLLTLHDFWFVCSNTWLYRYNGELCPGPGLGYHCGGCALQRLGQRPMALVQAGTAPLFVARTQVLRQALKAAHWFIAPSQLSARIFVEHGIPSERLTVLPPVVLAATSPRQLSPSPNTRPVRFVYLGSLIPAKGVHIIIEAFNRLDPTSAELHIYGDLQADPNYAEHLQKLAHQRRGAGLVFKGRADRNEVNGILSEADLLLFPSLWYETYAIVVDEALNASLPVLVSAHTAAAERIQSGVNGLTAPAGEVGAWQVQMQSVIDDPELLSRLRQGIKPPPHLSEHVTEMETLYTRVLSIRSDKNSGE